MMSTPQQEAISPSDRQRLRELQKRVAEIAHSPVNEERRRLWKKHAAFKGERAMVLAEHGGVPDMVPGSSVKCTGARARGIEGGLLHTIFRFEQVADDHVVEPYATYNSAVGMTGYGVDPVYHRPQPGVRGSCRWDAPITDLDKDFHKLKTRVFSVNREATARNKAAVEELWDGIFPVRRRGGYWWTTGMTGTAIVLIGLEGLMMAMVDNPEGLHRIMAFLRDDQLAIAKWLEKEELLNLNNENDYIGSGSEGYTHELPQPDWKEGMPVRLKDQWVLSESQETVLVSPAMFEEFVFPYQLDLVKEFGISYYGCCEPVHTRRHVLAKFPNLRRVSVSPWCDQKLMAEWCGNRIAFCRKPAPSLISTAQWDEDAIRADVRETLEIAKGCTVEFSMKDVHTLCDQPWRLGRWVQIAREEIEKAAC